MNKKNKRNYFKISVNGTENLEILKEQGIWGFPSTRGQYRTFIKNAKVNDRIVFTVKGKPVATAKVRTTPTEERMLMQFPNTKVYRSIFTVDLESFSAEPIQKTEDMLLKRSIVSFTDKGTYTRVTHKLPSA